MIVDYLQVIRDSREELKLFLKERDAVDARIRQIVIALRSLARLLPSDADRQLLLEELKAVRRKEPTLTEAISQVLQKAEEPMSGAQIRERLEDNGFDMSEYSQPLGTVLTTLNRMVAGGRVKRGMNREKAVTYRWSDEKGAEPEKK